MCISLRLAFPCLNFPSRCLHFPFLFLPPSVFPIFFILIFSPPSPPFFECKLWLLQRYSAAIHRRSLLFQLFSMKMQSPPLGCIKQDGNWYCLFFTSAHVVLFPLYCLSRKTWSRVSYWFLYRAVWSLEFCAYDKLLSCQLLKVHLVRQLIVESHFHLAKYWPTQWSAVLQTFKIL